MVTERGRLLVLAGVGLFVATVVASAALAPAVDAGSAAGTRTLIGVQGSGVGFQETGNVQLVNGTTTEWRRAEADSYFEVEALPDGRIVAAFVDRDVTRCGPYDPPCARTGYRIVDPGGTPEVASEFSFLVRSAVDSEVHAVEPLPGGRIAVADMDRERILIVDDGEITWEWRASSFYEAPPDPTRVDWLHVNDVNYLGDGRFLVSVRNANQLVIVERGAGVTEVINADRGVGSERTCRLDGELEDWDGDGEVRCGDPAVIHRQHNPHWLGDGAVLVADSDNDRVVELHRTAGGTWEPVWSLSGAGGLAFSWPRDADRLPDGTTLVSDTYNKRVVAVNATGDMQWSRGLADNPYEADRLPAGESTGVPRWNGSGVSLDPGAADLPVLSTLTAALHTAIPGLPFWVGEVQVGLALVSLGLLVAGVAIRLRG